MTSPLPKCKTCEGNGRCRGDVVSTKAVSITATLSDCDDCKVNGISTGLDLPTIRAWGRLSDRVANATRYGIQVNISTAGLDRAAMAMIVERGDGEYIKLSDLKESEG